MRFVQMENKGQKDGEWWRSPGFREIGDVIYEKLTSFITN